MDTPDSNNSRKPSPATTTYYYELVTFKVEDRIYRVPRHGFSHFSNVFETMFTLPQSENSLEGGSDDHPIELSGCSPDDFEALLDILYPTSHIRPKPVTKAHWISVLKLSTQWAMDEARALAISKLSESSSESLDLSILEKLSLAKTYNISVWLVDGYADLIARWGMSSSPSESPSIQEAGEALGWDTIARLLYVMSNAMQAKAEVTTAPFTCPNSHCGRVNGRRYVEGYFPVRVDCEACGTSVVKVTGGIEISGAGEDSDDEKKKILMELVKKAFQGELEYAF